jgi:uncharacterized protein
MILISGAVVAQYTAYLTLVYLILSFNVIRIRRSLGIKLGSGTNHMLERAVRMHGNFSEYVPLGLLLLLVLELQRFQPWVIHLCGFSLIVGRVLHAVALHRDVLAIRIAGMILTFVSLGGSAILLVGRTTLGLW